MKAEAPEKYHKQLTPDYPLGCKRLVLDSNYLRSLHNKNVGLQFTRVKNVTPHGIQGADGNVKDFDIIIWATGFLATMPFASTKVYGRTGEELHDRWNKEGAPSAYAGLAVPDFPNFYITTGPNTLSGHFSVTTIIEIQAQWISQLLKLQLDNEVKSFEVTKEAHTTYNSWIREKMQGMVWTSNLCNSWFKTKDGLVPTNFPGTTM
jgi:cation diffusion facilitator CzcD-associated flavoprotein CzcO